MANDVRPWALSLLPMASPESPKDRLPIPSDDEGTMSPAFPKRNSPPFTCLGGKPSFLYPLLNHTHHLQGYLCPLCPRNPRFHDFLFNSFFSTHTGFSLNTELVNCLAQRRLNMFPDPFTADFLGCHTQPGKDPFNPSPLESPSTTTPFKKGDRIQCSILN